MKLSDRHVVDPIVIDHGEGVWVWDDKGTPYIEAVAGMWCAAFGFGDEELAAVGAEQLRRLPYYHTLGNKTVGPAAELAEKLASLVPVRDAKVHLAASGSEANDFLVKFLRYVNNAVGRPARKTVIARVNGYHGATMMSSSLTGIARMHEEFDLPLPGVRHVSEPHFFRNGAPGETPEEFAARLVDELESLIVAEGPETIAGFLAEPVAGAGGVIIPPPGYHDGVQHVLARYDIPFCADEVITGFCRTGEWFGTQAVGIQPSTMSLGKGLSSAYQPIAALVLSGDLYEGLEKGSDNVGTFAHGATYSGHPVAAAVALRCVQLMEERDIVGHVRSVAPTFERRLRALADHPLVGEVRVIGLMGAVEFVADKATRRGFDPPGRVALAVANAALSHGLIVRNTSVADTICFSPPLVITEPEINELFDRFTAALTVVTEAVG